MKRETLEFFMYNNKPPAAVRVWRCTCCGDAGWVIRSAGFESFSTVGDHEAASNYHRKDNENCSAWPLFINGFEGG